MDDFSIHLKNIASTFSTDRIIILGKGASLDEIDKDAFQHSLIIGINDAERIVPVDITLFREGWVEQALQHSGHRSRLYISPRDHNPAYGESIKVPLASHDMGHTDLMMQRLLADGFELEAVLFLSALKLARLIRAVRKTSQEVYLVGFDFDSRRGYAREISPDFSPASQNRKTAHINPQEFYFLNAQYILQESGLEILHVGERSFSKLTPEEFNRRFTPTRIADGATSPEHAVEVIAELTTNHFGNRNRLERLVRAAHSCGADYVKVQKRDVESFYPQEKLNSDYVSPFGKTFRDYRHALELSGEDFEFLDNLCKQLGISWFVSVLDRPSYEFLREFNPPIIKLPSTISEHRNYLEFVAQKHAGPIAISTGMTDQAYEDWLLERFQKPEKIYLMQCTSAYPAPPEHCNVGVVRRYRDLSRDDPRIVPGYSSHDPGSFGSALAVAAGARIVEKHIKLGNTDWAHFDAVALDVTTDEFRDFVEQIRMAEAVVGSERKQILDSEHHKYQPA